MLRLYRVSLPAVLALACLTAVGCEAGKDDTPDFEGGNGGTTGSGGVAASGDGDGDGSVEPMVDPNFDPDDPIAVATAGGPDRNKVVAGEVCDRLTTIQCAGEALCCDNPGRDYMTCKNIMQEGCIKELLLDAVSLNPRSGFDADHAATAFAQFEEMASRCDPAITSWGANREGLSGMLKGTVNPGGECKPPMAAMPLAAEAAASLVSCKSAATHACMPADYTIAPIPRAMWRCDPRTGNGGDCYSDANCQDGLFCDNPDFEKVLTAACKPKLAVGASCDQARKCQTLICKGGACVAANEQTAYCLVN